MNTYLSHKERLEQILHYTKKTQSGLARELGVPQPNINAVLMGKSPEMSKGIMVAILKRYSEIDAFWLLVGEGEMLREKKSEKKYGNQAGGNDLVGEPEGVYETAGGRSATEWMERYHALQDKYIALLEEFAELQKRVRETKGEGK